MASVAASTPDYEEGNVTQLQSSLSFTVNGLRVLVKQKSSESQKIGTGAAVWDASKILAMYLEYNVASLRLADKAVLELGAGCGLGGLGALALGAKSVTFTDLEEVVPLLSSNVEGAVASLAVQLASASQQGGSESVASLGSVRVLPFKWGDDVSELGGPFPVVLAADCVFIEKAVPPLIASLRALVTAESTVFVCHELRCTTTTELFEAEARKYFSVSKVPKKRFHPQHWCEAIVMYVLRLLVADGEVSTVVERGAESSSS